MSYGDKLREKPVPGAGSYADLIGMQPPPPPPGHECCKESPSGLPWEGYYFSAYGIAVKHGFSGTEQEWLEMLKGKDGKDGISGKETYVHHQYSASDEWVINHDMDAYPSVTVVDSAGTKVYGEVGYVDNNSLVIGFTAPFAGTAYLN